MPGPNANGFTSQWNIGFKGKFKYGFSFSLLRAHYSSLLYQLTVIDDQNKTGED